MCFVEEASGRGTIDDLIALDMFQSTQNVSEQILRQEMEVVKKLVELREKHQAEYEANGALPDLGLESTSEESESESDDDGSDDDSDETGDGDGGDGGDDRDKGKGKKARRNTDGATDSGDEKDEDSATNEEDGVGEGSEEDSEDGGD